VSDKLLKSQGWKLRIEDWRAAVDREGLGLLRSVDRYPLTWRTDPIKGIMEVGGVGSFAYRCVGYL